MTPIEFAKMLRATSECREKSWVSEGDLGHYEKSWAMAAVECCPHPWPGIVSVLLVPGYCDVWDWCDVVDPQ